MLQGAQQTSLCTPQNSVQLQPYHNYCCGAVQLHQKTWTHSNNSMRNHTTIFNWELSSGKILSKAPLRACFTQSAHAWWKSTRFQGSWNLILLGKENWSFSPWNAPSQRQMYFSSLWAHSTSTLTLTSSHHLHPNLRGLQLTLGGAALWLTQPKETTAQCLQSGSPQCHHAGFQLAFLHFHLGPNLPRHSFH